MTYKPSNVNQITSYFVPQTTTTITPNSKIHSKSFSITSLTVAQFVQNEGSEIFSLKEYQPPFCLYAEQKRFKFQCTICSKFNHKTGGRVKYIEGDTLTQNEINSISYFKSIKRGIFKHVSFTNTHRSSVASLQAISKPFQALYVKIETVFFMIKRSLPCVVFEEIMIFLYRLIKYFGCEQHENCIDIGDKQLSVREAKRIIAVFQNVTKRQIISVIQLPSYSTNVQNIIYFSISIDGWSKS